MKKLMTAGMMILLSLLVVSAAGAQSGEKSTRGNISGVYDVTFTSEQGQQQTAKITIEDRQNGKVDVSGDYKGYPVSITGDLTGDPDQEGAVCSFRINQPGIITGEAELVIKLVNNKYQLEGQGSGSYSYLGRSGQFSGQVQGERTEPVTKSAGSSLRNAALGTGMALVLALLIYLVWRRRSRRIKQ